MPFQEYAPLALEKMIVGSIVVFTAVGLNALAAGKLHHSYQLSNSAAWLYFILATAACIAMAATFQIADRLAPYVQPYMWLIGLISIVVNAAIWSMALVSLFDSFARKRSIK
ncbi:hypothetical protein [Pseudomonas viridiflava]